MYETYITVVGRIITAPEKRRTLEGHSVVTFRMASNERRFRDGEWGDGDSLYLGVTCWRSPADNVHMSLVRGDAVIVRGRLRTREFVDKEGNRRSVVDMEAQAIGPDLFHSTARVLRAPRSDLSLAASDPWSDAVPGGADAGSAPGATADPSGAADGGSGRAAAPATPSARVVQSDSGPAHVVPIGEPAHVPRPGAASADGPTADPEARAREAVDAVFGEAAEDAPVERSTARRRPRAAAPVHARTHEDDPTEAAVRV